LKTAKNIADMTVFEANMSAISMFSLHFIPVVFLTNRHRSPTPPLGKKSYLDSE
jgi:hypothetical protein